MTNDFKSNPNRIKNLNINCSKEEGLEIVEKYGKNAWENFKNLDFPYPTYDIEELKKEWNYLLNNDGSLNSKASSKIINHFHKSIYVSKKYNHMSPKEYWEYIKTDFDEFKKFYFNRLTRSDYFKIDGRKDTMMRKGIVPTRIYFVGLTTSMVAPRVTIFKPQLAKYIITKYLNQYDIIFDPCSGYSGRMLGALASNKIYIGRDINYKTIQESQQIYDELIYNPLYDFFNFKYELNLKQADLFEYNGKYDCLFTCTPYRLKEIWNNNEKDLTCDEWIDAILERYECKKYVFVVDESKKYKNYIVEDINNEAHFSKNYEHIIII